jgi:hypothetical protein
MNSVELSIKKNMARLAKLSGKREIVAYCRGPYCVLSVEVVALLRGTAFRPVVCATAIRNGSGDRRLAPRVMPGCPGYKKALVSRK